MMTGAGTGCQQEGFRDVAVSTTQSEYKIRLENGWPKKFEGVIVGDTLGIGVPGNDLPDMIGSGRIEGDRINLTFPDCKVTRMPH